MLGKCSLPRGRRCTNWSRCLSPRSHEVVHKLTVAGYSFPPPVIKVSALLHMAELKASSILVCLFLGLMTALVPGALIFLLYSRFRN